MNGFVDVDRTLPEEHRLLRQALRRFVEAEIVPAADAWEEAREIPRAVFERLGELGFLGLGFPSEYGGGGLDAVASIVLNEELARSTHLGLAASIGVHSDMTALHLVRVGTDAQRWKYLPDILAGRAICALGVTEPGGSSDLLRMKTSAVKYGDEYVLNGRKMFITNANQADLFFVIARTDEHAKGAKGFTLFLVERGFPGFSNGQKFEKTGLAASDLGELLFEDCRVPAENVLGEVGLGFGTMLAGVEHERLCLSAQAVGAAEKAIELTLEWLRGRAAYGKTLWDLQAVRHEVSRLACELAAAKLLLYHAAEKSSRKENATREVCMVKALVPEVANRVLYKCVQFHGAMGYMRETPVERIARDVRFMAIGGGASEVMLDEVAKRL